jgi:RNA polymerase sigma-54 factor
MYLGPHIEPQINISPQVVLASEILQLPAADLERRVLQELEENPALDRVDAFCCIRCGAPVAEGQRLCYQCARQAGTGDDSARERRHVDAWIPELITLEQHVWAQLRLLLPPSLHSLAELVVGYLDEQGFLPLSNEELARRHRVSVADVDRVVAALHQVEPVGMGARDAREALLIQIQYLSRGVRSPRLMLACSIVQEHWMLLKKGERVWGEIARAQGVSVDAVREAVAFVIRDLNPFPAQAWKGDTRSSPSAVSATVQPDLLLHVAPCASGEEFEVEFLERYRFELRINELYAELGRGNMSGVDENDIETARYYLEEARLLLHSLAQRRRTLIQVSLALAEYQRDFVLRGPRCLRPLTRARLAMQLGVHESTVSRAVAHKYIQMPDRRVIPLADFFDNSLPAKYDLQALIIQEDEAHPCSDRVLATQLRDLGHDITRRTVTKYRQALGIPSSRFRHLAAQYRGLAHQCPSGRASGRAL